MELARYPSRLQAVERTRTLSTATGSIGTGRELRSSTARYSRSRGILIAATAEIWGPLHRAILRRRLDSSPSPAARAYLRAPAAPIPSHPISTVRRTAILLPTRAACCSPTNLSSPRSALHSPPAPKLKLKLSLASRLRTHWRRPCCKSSDRARAIL